MAEAYRPGLAERAADARATAHQAQLEYEALKVAQRHSAGSSGLWGRIAGSTADALEKPVRQGGRRLQIEALNLEYELEALDQAMDSARARYEAGTQVLEESPPQVETLEALAELSRALRGPNAPGRTR